MLFNSYVFIFGFLPITIIVFFALCKFHLIKGAIWWLAFASLFFYAYWNISYLPIMLISVGANYYIGEEIQRSLSNRQRAKTLLWVGIILNLANIGYYKYANFFVTSWNQLFHTEWSISEISLPLAISFYTFTQIAYLVDVYRGEHEKYKYDLVSYSLFISFFPQLIAGPILRHNELIPELRQIRTFVFSHKNVAMGLTMFILGLSKKVIIADNISPWVAPVFSNASDVSFLEAWTGSLSYTLQLYFDFSGYSDMAVGLGWMFNIPLPYNFNSPYKATSITDFWRRWHITLSNFLRDYLYIPLGGNRQGEIRRYVNLMITMLLGGLWHGAGWTFVLWGGIHGLFLVIHQLWRKLNISLPKLLCWTLTFLAVVASWVLFRAHNIHTAKEILKAMVGMKGFILPTSFESQLNFLTPLGVQFKELGYLPSLGLRNTAIVLIGLLLCVTLLPNTQQFMQRFKPTQIWIVVTASLAVFCLISLNRVSEFLYFQF